MCVCVCVCVCVYEREGERGRRSAARATAWARHFVGTREGGSLHRYRRADPPLAACRQNVWPVL